MVDCGSELFQLLVELNRLEFGVITSGDKEFSNVEAEVAFGDVAFGELLVALIQCKIEKALHVFIDQEFEDRAVLEVECKDCF